VYKIFILTIFILIAAFSLYNFITNIDHIISFNTLNQTEHFNNQCFTQLFNDTNFYFLFNQKSPSETYISNRTSNTTKNDKSEKIQNDSSNITIRINSTENVDNSS